MVGPKRWTCLVALHFPLFIRFSGIGCLAGLRGWRQGIATGVGGPSEGRGEGMVWARGQGGQSALGSKRLSQQHCVKAACLGHAAPRCPSQASESLGGLASPWSCKGPKCRLRVRPPGSWARVCHDSGAQDPEPAPGGSYLGSEICQVLLPSLP